MAISTIFPKAISNAFNRVTKSSTGTTDKEGNGNFYQKNDEQSKDREELSKDPREVYDFLQKEIIEFEECDHLAKDKGFRYKLKRNKNRISVQVITESGKILREMEPSEFIRIRRSTKVSTGKILDSVF